MYANSIVDLNLSLDEADRIATIFEEEIILGKALDYAQEYAKLRVICNKSERFARTMLEIFEKCINIGMSQERARKRALVLSERLEKEPMQKRPKC